MDSLPRVTSATVAVLSALHRQSGPTWGLLVVRETGRAAGTVYPILDRLERAGWVTSSWEEATVRSGPRRRLYVFTAEGAVAAADLVAEHSSAQSGSPRRRRARPVTVRFA